MKWRQIDWLGFVVRFICGGMLGVIVGAYWWAHGDLNDHGTVYIVAGVLVVGLLSAIFGDDFWENIRGWWV